MVAGRRMSISVIFTLLLLAAIGIMISALAIRPRMEDLRQQGQSAGAAFHRLHKLSEAVYMGQAMALLVAGAILPAALTLGRSPPADSRPRTAPEAAPPTTPPVGPADRVGSS